MTDRQEPFHPPPQMLPKPIQSVLAAYKTVLAISRYPMTLIILPITDVVILQREERGGAAEAASLVLTVQLALVSTFAVTQFLQATSCKQ